MYRFRSLSFLIVVLMLIPIIPMNDTGSLGANAEELEPDDLNTLSGTSPGGGSNQTEWWGMERLRSSYQDHSISMELDSSGYPFILQRGYYSGEVNLILSHWNGSEWEEMAVDTIGSSSDYSSLAVDSNDRAHISYYNDTSQDLMYAVWNGSGWERTIVESTGQVGEYSSITLDTNDMPHIAYYNRSDYTLRYSYKDGNGWHGSVLIDPHKYYIYRDIEIELDSNDHPYIITQNGSAYIDYVFYNGSGWEYYNNYIKTTYSYSYDISSMEIDSQDDVHIVYASEDLKLTHMEGSDGSWANTTLNSTYNKYKYPGLTIDGNDRPHIAARGFYNADLYLNYTFFNGTSWNSEEVYTDSGSIGGTYTDISVDGDGVVYIAYNYIWTRLARRNKENIQLDFPKQDFDLRKGNTYTVNFSTSRFDAGEKLKVELYRIVDPKTRNNDLLQMTITTSLDASSDHFNWTISQDLDVGWLYSLKVSWSKWTMVNDVSDHFQIMTSKGWLTTEIDHEDILYESSMATDEDGDPHVVYIDNDGNRSIKYSVWNDNDWFTETVDYNGIFGNNPSITIDGTGSPHIAYFETTGSELRYATKNSSGWQIWVVDSSLSSSTYTSIAVNSTDKPMIAYLHDTNYDLKIAKWNGSGFDIEMVDPNGQVGTFPSLQIDSNDLAHVSYSEISGSRLVRYAYYNGTRWNITTLPKATDASNFQLDSADVPHLFYVVYNYNSSYDYELIHFRWNGSAFQHEVIRTMGYIAQVKAVIDDADNIHLGYRELVSSVSHTLMYGYQDGSIFKFTPVFDDDNWNYHFQLGALGEEVHFITNWRYSSYGGYSYDLQHQVLMGYPSVPSPPVITNVDYDKDSITVHFLPSTDEGGLSVDKFELYRGNSTENLTLAMTKNVNYLTTDFSFDDIYGVNREQYVYQVRAVNALGSSGPSNNYSFYMNISVLLVDDDGGSTYDDHFENALEGAGIEYRLYDAKTSTPGLANLRRYDAVIWTTGDQSAETLKTLDQSNLATFLSEGGALFLSGQDILYDLNFKVSGTINNDFVNSYLNVTKFGEVAYSSVKGKDNDIISDPFGTVSLSYPFQNYADTLTMGTGGVEIFENSTGATTALRVDNETFRLIFLGFSFESFMNTNSSWGQQLMDRSIEWLLSDPGTPSPPRNISLIHGSGYNHLYWEAPEYNGTSNITDYLIYRKTISEDSFSIIGSLFAPTFDYNDTTASTDEVYVYYVVANNSAGSSIPTRQIMSDETAPILGTDTSDTNAYTGNDLTFSIQVTDDQIVDKVTVEYWIGSGSKTIGDMSGTGPYTLTISISSGASGSLHYKFSARDKAWNTVKGDRVDISIIDDDRPMLEDLTVDTTGTTGEEVTLIGSAQDNIGTESWRLLYRFGSDPWTNTTFDGSRVISISHNSTSDLQYQFKASDPSGNWNSTLMRTITISDNDAPVFGPDRSSISATTGDSVNFMVDVYDNIVVDNVYLEYWYGTGIHYNISMVGAGPIYTASFIGPSDSTDDLNYFFSAVDGSVNWAKTITSIILVSDDDRPTFSADITPSFATTGETLTFSVDAGDNIGVSGVYVEYWFGSYQKTNTTMIGSGTYKHLISIPSDRVLDLHYSFSAVDGSGNWGNTLVKDVSVIDNDLPSFGTDGTDTSAWTGGELRFSMIVTDNIDVSKVYLLYRIGSGSIMNISLNGRYYWNHTIDVPDNDSSDITYMFQAVDTQGNWASTSWKTVGVRDDDAPYFGMDLSHTTATTGEVATLRIYAYDNIGIQDLYIDYWFGTGTHSNITVQGSGPLFGLSILIPSDSTDPLYYVISAVDSSGNWGNTIKKTISISDNDPAVFSIDNTPATGTTGDPLTFSIDVSDNIGLYGVYVEYWYSGYQATNTTLTGTGTYKLTIDVLDIPGPLHYFFSAVDNSANLNKTMKRTINIIDDDRPDMGDDGTPSTAGTGNELTFSIMVTDNVGISDVRLIYSQGTGPDINISLSGSIYWNHTITLPTDDPNDITYIFKAVDRSGNWASSASGTVTIEDDDDPMLLSDLTPDTAGTGDDLTFLISAMDNIGIEDVVVEYWFGIGSHATISLDLDLSYYGTITIPDDSLDGLNYFITITDFSGNSYIGEDTSIEIKDTILPALITDETESSATTGDKLIFSAIADDNIAVSKVMVEYWFGSGVKVQTTLYGENSLEGEITIPANTMGGISYRFIIEDTSANVNITEVVVLSILDNDGPWIIEDLSDNTASTGDEMIFHVLAGDNIGLDYVNISYWFDSGEEVQIQLLNEADAYKGTIQVPSELSAPINYMITVADTSGNQFISDPVSVSVQDDDAPLLIDHSIPETAVTPGSIKIDLNISDNIGISDVTLLYVFKGSDIGDITMVLENGSYHYTIGIPDQFSGELYLSFSTTDTSGNVLEGDLGVVIISDGIPPVISDINDLTLTVGDILEVIPVVSDNIGVISYQWSGSPFEGNEGYLIGVVDESRTYEVELTIYDLAGNHASVNFTITVLEAPTDDTDGDLIPDEWEEANGLDSSDPSDADLDPDEDGLSNLAEYLLDTDPNLSDKKETSDDKGNSYLVPAIVLLLVVLVEAAVIGFLFQKGKNELHTGEWENDNDLEEEDVDEDIPELDEILDQIEDMEIEDEIP